MVCKHGVKKLNSYQLQSATLCWNRSRFKDKIMAVGLSDREIEVVRQTAREVMKEAGHICHFSEPERKQMHSFNDVVTRERADHGTFTILIQSGNTVRDVTRKFLTTGIWIIIGLVAAIVGAFVIKGQ